MNIHLVLSFEWFDEMAAGRKDIEYRNINPHWTKLIWNRRKLIKNAIFSRGYTKTRIKRCVFFIDKGMCPYEGWGGNYYRIYLGPITNSKEAKNA